MANLLKRQRGAILGGIVADAAARPLHWVYKSDKVQEAILGKDNKTKLEDFAFLTKNICTFYELPLGSNSCYGDEFIATLKAFDSNGNDFNLKIYKDALYETFGGDNNQYQISRKDRGKDTVKGPWIHGSMIDFVDNYDAKKDKTGGNHADNDGLMGALSLTVILCGQSPNFFDIEDDDNDDDDDDDEKKIDTKEFPKDLIRATIEAVIIQKDVIDRGVFMCHLLWDILTGDNRDNMVLLIYIANEKYNKNDNKTVYNEINAVLDDCNVIRSNNNGKMDAKIDTDKALKFKGQRETVEDKGYGKAMGNPGSFKSALYNIIQHCKDYKIAILEEIEAGGDNCGRSLIDGCIIGAWLGEDCIPKQWIKKTNKITEVEQLLKNVLSNY